MKSLQLAKPLLLLVVGLPGAGKSFFARQFSETFAAPIVNAEALRCMIVDEPMFTAEEQDLIDKLATHFTQEIAKTKRSFIIDGNCNSKQERQQLYTFAKKEGYDICIVWVQTEPATAKFRATRAGNARPADSTSAPLNAAQFAAAVKKFTPPTNENYVVISGKHTYATQAKMVLRRLAAPRAEAAARAYKQQPAPPARPAQPAVAAKVPARKPAAPARRNVVIQ